MLGVWPYLLPSAGRWKAVATANKMAATASQCHNLRIFRFNFEVSFQLFTPILHLLIEIEHPFVYWNFILNDYADVQRALKIVPTGIQIR